MTFLTETDRMQHTTQYNCQESYRLQKYKELHVQCNFYGDLYSPYQRVGSIKVWECARMLLLYIPAVTTRD